MFNNLMTDYEMNYFSERLFPTVPIIPCTLYVFHNVMPSYLNPLLHCSVITITVMTTPNNEMH